MAVRNSERSANVKGIDCLVMVGEVATEVLVVIEMKKGGFVIVVIGSTQKLEQLMACAIQSDIGTLRMAALNTAKVGYYGPFFGVR